MTRILFWLGLLVLVLLALRSKVRSMRARTDARGQAATLPPAEAMCCCAHCGIHFPASEAIRANDREFCSPAHARLPAP